MNDGLEACFNLLMDRSSIFWWICEVINMFNGFFFLVGCDGRILRLRTLGVLVILCVNDGLYVFRTHEKHDCGLKFQEETLFGYFSKNPIIRA